MPELLRDKQLQDWARENVVERMLLRQAAARDRRPVSRQDVTQAYEQLVKRYGGREKFLETAGLKPEDERKVRQDVELDLRVQRLTEEIQAGAVATTDETVKRYYQQHMQEMIRPESVRVAHIVKHPAPGADIDALEAELQQALAEIRAGAEFAEVVRKHSDCADNDGDLGFFPKGEMVPEFEDVVFDLEVGAVSEVFRTPFGVHIAKLLERRPATAVPFSEVRPQIEAYLERRSREEALEAFVDREKETAKIEER
jgi:parvulin-like peptidyl-prolyl isomerase